MKRMLDAFRLLLTLKCEESTKIVSASLDRELSWVERWAVRLHYISCWSCRRFGKQVRQMKNWMAAYGEKTAPTQLSSEAIQRIEDAIHRVD